MIIDTPDATNGIQDLLVIGLSLGGIAGLVYYSKDNITNRIKSTIKKDETMILKEYNRLLEYPGLHHTKKFQRLEDMSEKIAVVVKEGYPHGLLHYFFDVEQVRMKYCPKSDF